MAPRKALFYHSPALERYEYPDECPFKISRAATARKTADNMGWLTGHGREERPPEALDRTTLEMFHSPGYLDALAAAGNGDLDVNAFAMGLGTPDCPVFKGMYDHAALASGATVEGAQAILDGEASVAFNPSGGFHHAASASCTGFCYVNDVVLACMTLSHAGKKVMFIDVDAHHCDGVQDAFIDRDDIMTVSLHESGKTLFPGTGFVHDMGEGKGRGYAVNVPLPVGTYDEVYLRVFRAVVLPLIDVFAPDVLVVEFGMDGLSGDPLAHLNLTNNAYADIAEIVVGIERPVLATGGGGYSPDNTARGWALVWSILCGADKGDDLVAGLGGVMLETTEWQGGLRDHAAVSHGGHMPAIAAEAEDVVESVREDIFPIHGI